jgi:hypothetical protein
MLSSAHILAMDTKNLLDVIDSIRARFPDVKQKVSEVEVTEQQIYCNQADIGIYDNHDAIQEQQLKIVEEVDSQFNSQKILIN